MASEWAAAARLVRRTGFGATGSTVDAVVKEGAAHYVSRILAADPKSDPGAKQTPPPTFEPVAAMHKDMDPAAKKQRRKAQHGQDQKLVGWWLRRMLAVHQPFGEKATFAWHSHFATSLKKVKSPQLMFAQNDLLRRGGRGDFDTLANAMLVNGATLRWLDGEKNDTKGPNENLSREFMEIFTLGHADGYTEQDVREGARALTGWKINRRTGEVTLRAPLHDDKPKTLFGKSADYDARGFCTAVLARPGHPEYLATRMWHQFVSNNDPSPATLAKLVAAYGDGHDLHALFTTMFTDDSFAAAEGTYIIGPVEWLIGAMRTLQVPVSNDKALRMVAAALNGLGQLPLYPPSVGGWPSGMVWVSTASADLRFRAATMLMKSAHLPTLSGSTTTKLETVAHLLGVQTWSNQTLAVLKGSVGDPRTLLPVALNTPEYLVH